MHRYRRDRHSTHLPRDLALAVGRRPGRPLREVATEQPMGLCRELAQRCSKSFQARTDDLHWSFAPTTVCYLWAFAFQTPHDDTKRFRHEVGPLFHTRRTVPPTIPITDVESMRFARIRCLNSTLAPMQWLIENFANSPPLVRLKVTSRKQKEAAKPRGSTERTLPIDNLQVLPPHSPIPQI
jgi:hypothetical protein